MKGQAGFDAHQIAPVPRISLQAFCESAETARIIEAAAADRRMERAHVTVHIGGPAAAVSAFRDAPTPNVIVLDTAASRRELKLHLDTLSSSVILVPRWWSPGARTTSSFIASLWRAESANISSLR